MYIWLRVLYGFSTVMMEYIKEAYRKKCIKIQTIKYDGNAL